MDKRSDIMKKFQFKVEDVFGVNLSKESISPEKATKPQSFFTKMMSKTNC